MTAASACHGRRRGRVDQCQTADTPTRVAFASVVQRSRTSRHDRALPRALPELWVQPRGIAVRSSDHRHCADRLRPFARATGTILSWQSGSRTASARRAASRSNSRSIPIQETGKRPTAGLDRNLAYLGLVETLYGYPLDGVVLTIGCDKTTPACLMAAATVDIPAIALSVGPMLNGWFKGQRTGSGTIVWEARRQMLAAGEIDYDGLRRSGRPPRRRPPAIATRWARRRR